MARHRKFSRAAEALFITPSALSISIRQLETQLGFRLFERTTRLVALTPQGQQFLSVAQTNLEQFDSSVSQLSQSARKPKQSVSLGANPGVAADILPLPIKEFRSVRPDLRIELFEADPQTIMERIQAGKLDMGLGAFLKPPPGIRRTPFFRFTLMLIRADTDPGFRPATTTWSAIDAPVLISLPPSNAVQQLINQRFARAGVRFEHNVVLNYLETVIAMVEADEGIAVIPSFAMLACSKRKVFMSRLTNPVVDLNYYIATDRDKKLPPAAEDFISFLKSNIARWAGPSGVL